MRFQIYGCRGSIPVAGRQYMRYGGNTTCIRMMSDLLPDGCALLLDAGSGMIPASRDLLAEKIRKVFVLFTHYHWDHTIGLTLSPISFMKSIELVFGGPVQDGVGTKEMCESLFRQPYFPVDFKSIASHVEHMRFDVPSTKVLLFHREGGFSLLDSDEFERLTAQGRQMPFADLSYRIEECIVIRMHRSNHPEQTISYRVEEMSTGQRFALLTDHENQDGIPQALRAHLRKVDTLIADCQYTREQYIKSTAGFGHGTPDYVVRLAREVEARHVVLTHHDPTAGDDAVDRILEEARICAAAGDGHRPVISAACDGSLHEVRPD